MDNLVYQYPVEVSVYLQCIDRWALLLFHLLIGHEKRALEDTYLFVYHLQIIYPQCEFNWPGNPRGSLESPPPPAHSHLSPLPHPDLAVCVPPPPRPLSWQNQGGLGSDRQPERAQPGQRSTHWRGQAHVKWGVEASWGALPAHCANLCSQCRQGGQARRRRRCGRATWASIWGPAEEETAEGRSDSL